MERFNPYLLVRLFTLAGLIRTLVDTQWSPEKELFDSAERSVTLPYNVQNILDLHSCKISLWIRSRGIWGDKTLYKML